MKTRNLIILLVIAMLGFTSCNQNPEALKAELLSAVKAANTDKVAKCIAKGAELNEPETPGGWYPIHYAVKSGSIKMVNLLLKSGADPRVLGVSSNQANDQQQFSVPPVVVAQMLGHAEIAKMLEEAAKSK